MGVLLTACGQGGVNPNPLATSQWWELQEQGLGTLNPSMKGREQLGAW